MASKVEILWCRSFQAVLKIGNYFMGYRTPVMLEGPGKSREVGALLKERGLDRILVVTGESMFRRGAAAPLLEGLEAAGLTYTVQTFAQPDPTDLDVEEGYRTYRENDCRAIVALGGGSRIDCAKAIAAKAVHPKKTAVQLQGLLKVHRPIPTFVAIPTTAGAGSETTVAAVITDSATHRKASINDPFLIPKFAVLDPELTVGLPPRTTAACGMDALAHAVEAYTNRTYNTKLENELAKEAVALIHGNLRRACENGADLDARQKMQRGAFCAGRAFTRGCVGYVHAVGHTLGGLYGVAHGEAMAVLLPHVMRQYGAAVHKRLAELAEVCGMTGGSEAQRAEKFIRWMEETNGLLGLPKGFPQIREEDIPTMIAWARKEANPLYPVPVVWGEEELRKLIEALRT